MIKKLLFIFFIPVVLFCQTLNFDRYFEDATLRIDYKHIGNSEIEFFTIDKLYKYDIWAGSRKHLIDRLNNGKYYIKIYDYKTDKLIYSKGYDCYFAEYQTCQSGIDGIMKTFHEVANIPFPKNKIRFSIEKRNKIKELEEIYSVVLEPNFLNIELKKRNKTNCLVIQVHNGGEIHKSVDIVILGEGYTKDEINKFKNDLEFFKETFFSIEPYKSLNKSFNITGILKPSIDSGVDEPRANIYKNTSLNCTFNSLNSERYLLTEDLKEVHNQAASVPYDAIYIMCNTKRYGGGGIYNFYCTFTSDNQWKEYLFLHEFGHSFSGLADEYYTSDVAYNDFYPKGVEPNEPNITALLNRNFLKWKNLVEEKTPIPTKWDKDNYDNFDLKWQKRRRELNNKIAEAKRKNINRDSIKIYEQLYDSLDYQHAVQIDHLLRANKNFEKVGAFEGAGYSSKGLYRSMIDCIMFSKGHKPFCKVCDEAIRKVINTYTEK